MGQSEIAVFQQSIETCEDPAEIARKVKLMFKRMPGEMALACFAKVMTAGKTWTMCCAGSSKRD